ncbi:putative inner membrane protein [compost metagenome]
MRFSKLEDRIFLLLLAVVSLAFGWLLLPFYGAVFWATILAILFAPLQRRLLRRLGPRKSLAAGLTLLVCLLMVILPVIFIAGSLVQEGAALYQRLKSGDINLSLFFERAVAVMPSWAHSWLERVGLRDFSELQDRISTGAMQGSQFLATKAFSIGQNTFEFVIGFGVMLYLLFFLLRDGSLLAQRIKQAVPLSTEHKRHLFSKFTMVTRATVKGNVAVAITQGILGGLIFWFLGIDGPLLWGVVMAFLSLLPAVGTALVWMPAAIYFFVTGAVWQGVVLILFGVLVIGLVDNILRPILVGKDTKMPDYVVLISTIGGMVLFGINGFVIGPLIAALFIASWDLFSRREEQSQAE